MSFLRSVSTQIKTAFTTITAAITFSPFADLILFYFLKPSSNDDACSPSPLWQLGAAALTAVGLTQPFGCRGLFAGCPAFALRSACGALWKQKEENASQGSVTKATPRPPRPQGRTSSQACLCLNRSVRYQAPWAPQPDNPAQRRTPG